MYKKKNVIIYPNVHLGKNVKIEEFCIIGEPPRNKKIGELETVIGSNTIIRSSTVIYAGVKIGNGCQTGHGVLIRENNVIGNNCSIGTNSVLEPDNVIGNNVRIHSNCFLESAKIEDNVFIGPGVVFTDDPHPPCPMFKRCVGGAIVKKNVKIGANVTILPGVIIEENSLIGAGTVVNTNVPKNKVVVGNPARVIKEINSLKCWKKFFKRPYIWEKK